jgi:radical SAM superfamily enzyme YgiQ (UPF0313 family)
MTPELVLFTGNRTPFRKQFLANILKISYNNKMKKRVALLIAPRIQDDFGYTPAGASLVKASIIKAGHECKIFDFNAELDSSFVEHHEELVPIDNWFLNHNFYSEKVFTKILELANRWVSMVMEYKPTNVGISVFSYNSQRATLLLATLIKARDPGINIFMGGAGLNTDNNFGPFCMEQRVMDCWIRGEGELSVQAYLKGDMSHPGINGIPPKQINDIDDLEFPDYSDYELASYTNKKGLVALPITGSRGCVRACTFCDIASMWPSYKYRSGHSIATEIKTQVKKYGAKAFRFTDSLINGSMKAFRDMTHELSTYRKSLKPEDRFIWDSHFIVRSRKQMPPEDFVKMAESGAGTLLIGVESGSPTVREHMKKGYTDEDLHYSLGEIFKNNIKVRFLMIIGYPTETAEDYQQTLRFFKKYAEYGRKGLVEEVNLGLTLNLLPNTPLYDNAEKHGLETTKDHINDWVCSQNPTLDFKERLKRRIEAQYHVEKLGYKVFESKNYVRALSIAWEEVDTISKGKTIKVDASKIKFDREKGVLESKDFDPLRTY